jgi:hypothetical protein
MTERAAVEQLFADYAWALDTRDLAPLDGVFAEEASFAFGDSVVSGREEVVGFIGASIAKVEGTRRHVITNVRLAGDEATAYLVRLVTREGTLRTESTGVYRFQVVQTAAGPRFGRCRLELDQPLPAREENA